VLWHILYLSMAHLMTSCGTLCAFLWHISLKVFLCRAVAHFVPSCGTFCTFLHEAHKSKSIFCAELWHILCLPVAHTKRLFVTCCGTCCAMLWHILCLPVAHFVQVKNYKKMSLNSLDSWKVFSRGLMNEKKYSLV
jgi:hypothetical protein